MPDFLKLKGKNDENVLFFTIFSILQFSKNYVTTIYVTAIIDSITSRNRSKPKPVLAEIYIESG